MRCLSTFSLDVKHPRAYQIVGDVMEKYSQKGARVMELKASISFNHSSAEGLEDR
jgi:hypothetical protein